MTTQMKNADQIIKDHVWFSLAPGFLPIPVLDVAAITGIQLDMIKQLCRLYEIDYNAEKGKSITMALFSTIMGRMPAYALRTAFKIVPIVGWALGGATMATLAGASTYATGAVFKEHFEEGGTLNNLDPESFRNFYRQQMEKGRQLLDEIFDSKKAEDS